jgi:hypothetical protein
VGFVTTLKAIWNPNAVGDQSRFAQSMIELVKMIPKNLKTITSLHLIIVVW